MGFLESAKKAGYSEAEAKAFQAKVEKAKKAGYSNDEIQQFLSDSGGIPQSKTPQIRAATPEDGAPDEGSIRAPRSSADQTADLIRGGRPTPFAQSIVKDAPEIIGATAAVAATGGAGLLPAMGAAALGGAGGKGVEMAVKQAGGANIPPETVAKEMGGAGARMGVAEGFGRALIKTIGWAAKGGFFEPSEEMAKKVVPEVSALETKSKGKDALFKGQPVEVKDKLLKTKDVNPKQLFESFGGQYTAAQMTNSHAIDTLDNMAQSSFVGSGVMDKTFAQQQKTVKEIGDHVANSFLEDGATKLSDRQLGQVFVDTVQKGRTAFKTAAEKMFRNVDDLVYESMQMANPEGNVVRKTAEELAATPEGPIVKSIPSDPSLPTTIGPKGKDPFTRIPAVKPSEAGYVSLKPIIEKAKGIIEEYSRVRDIGKSDVGGTLLDKVAALPETVTFGDAQLLRSNLLEELRSMAQKPGEGRASRAASDLMGLTDAQMEKAAKRLPNDALEAWRQANKFYKFGKNNFDNEFIHKLATSGKVNWEEVGDLVFRSGNVDEVYKARNALRSAEFTTKKAGSETPVDFKQSWKQMQSGYYESLIKKNTSPDGVLNPKGMIRDLNNRKTERTINAAFSNDQLNAIKNFAHAASLATSKNDTNMGGMVIQIAQGGAVLALASPDEWMGDFKGVVQKVAGGVLLGPYVLAKLLTNPMTTRWLIQGVKTPITSGASGGLAARLAASVIRDKREKAMNPETDNP